MEPNQNAAPKTTENCPAIAKGDNELSEKSGKQLIRYSVLWSIFLLLAVPFACLVSGEGFEVFGNLHILLTSPSKLVTDYFNLGSLGSAFLNAALCGFACNIITVVSKAKPRATLLAGYFLVIAHCFYGLNLFNMWAPFIGVYVFCRVRHEKFGDMIHIAMFATSLAPFISDFLFRYTLGDSFDPEHPQVTVLGVVLALLFGIGSGFIVPALLPGTTKMHRGHNLYKAGLAIGLFGMFAYALFYATVGIETPDTVVRANALYTDHGESYVWFIDLFFAVVFTATFLLGFFGNNKSLCGMRALFKCDGWQDDFTVKFGMPRTLINIGIYGFFILLYMNLAFLLPGVGFSGPTVGAVIAAITFASSGQTPRTVLPIAIGYTLLYALTGGICALASLPLLWSLSSQSYLNGFAFATGLCPISGRYGYKIGIVAGMLHAILCTTTAAMHGGFVLYNGGLTSGLCALLLIPILDFYQVKASFSDEAIEEKKKTEC